MKKDHSKRLSSKDALKSQVSEASSLTSLVNTISELEVRHKRLKELVENVEDVLVDIDANGRILYVTPNVEKYLGYRPEEVIGKIPTIFMPRGESAERYSHFLELASQGKKLEAMEMTYVHKEGHHFIMEAYALPYFGREGQLLGYRGVVRDVTERKRVEVQLRESRQQLEEVAEKYSTIIKTTSDGVWINNLKGEILEVNDAYCRMSGYSRYELIHMSVNQLEAIETPEEIADHIKKTVEISGHDRFETRHRRKDGSIFDVEISSLFFEKYGGRIAIFIRDITNRKRAEETVQMSEKRLKVMVEELDLRNRIADIFLTFPDNEMYGEVLQVILKFTESPYGVFGYIDENGDVVAPSLTRDVWKECRVHDKAIRFPRSAWTDTVWVRAIMQKKTIISNQPGRVPDGHIPITRVMVTPIMFQDRCIGYLKVANRPVDYNDNDRILLERIAGYIAPALDARLQRNVEERKRRDAEEALRESEEKYRQLVQNTTAIILRIDLQGRITFINDHAQSFFGYSANEILGRYAVGTIVPERETTGRDLASMVAQIVADPDSFHTNSNENIRKTGERVWVEWTNSSIFDREGRLREFLAVGIDITERKRAEEKLRESEERYRMIVDSAPDAVIVHRKGQFLYANAVALKLYGAETLEQLQSKTVLDLVHPDYLGSVAERIKRLEAGQSVELKETAVVRLDGQVVPVEAVASMVINYEGKPAIQVTIRDITERKRAEEAIRASTKKTETVLSSITDMYVSYDNEWRFIDLNPLAEKLMGKTRQELIGKVIWEVFPQLKESEIHEHYLKAVRDKSTKSFESYSPVTGRWHELYPYPTDDGLLVYLRDITDRKRTEELMAEALLFNRTILETSPFGIVTFHSSGRCVSANEAAVKMIGGSPEQILNFRLLESWKESGMLEAAENALSSGLVMSLETRLISSFSNDLWVNCRFAPFQHGGELHLLLLMSDMTERKRSEDLLQNEKLRLEVAQESAKAGTFEWNIQKSETIWSDQLKALYGFAPGEFKGFENWSSRVHPDDLRKSKKAIVESLRTGKYDDDFRVIWPDGSLHWLAARGRVVFDEHGSPLLMTGINMDVTERKRAEEALTRSRDELEDRVRERTHELSRIAEELRRSEEAYRLLVELNPVGVFRHVYDKSNKKSKRLHCNDAQLKLLGYSSLNEYLEEFPENTIIEEDWKKYISSLISEGKIVNFPAQMKRKDGNIIWVLLNAITRSDGKQLFIEGAMTEISEQKRTEKRLRSAQKMLRAMAAEIVMADERTRQHFATDLHDTVVQTLGAAKLRSQLIQESIPPEVKQIYTELQDMISQSITQSRLIMAEMSPPVLYELGFVPALEWLTEQIESRHGIPITFKGSNGPHALIHEIQVLLFQAARELLMNVVKHSRAENAIVKLSGDGNRVRIEVIDNGSGFDKRQAFRTDQSSGGYGLFSIRERLRHFGGELKIWSKPGEGTRVVMTAPRLIENDISET